VSRIKSGHFFLNGLREALCDLCETLCNPLVLLEGYTEFHKDRTELHGETIQNRTIINY